MFNLQKSLKFNILVFRSLGLWPNENFTFFYKLLTFYVIFSIYSTNLAVIIGLWSMPNLQAFMNVFYMCLSYLIISVKSVYFIRYNDIIQDLTKGIQKNRPKITEQQNEILVNYMNRWEGFFFLMTILISIMGCFAFIATPLLIDSQVHQLPVYAEYGVDYTQAGYYEVFFIYQSLSMCFMVFIHLNTDGVVAKLMAYAAGELLILQDSLEQIYEMTKRIKHVEENSEFYVKMNEMFIDLIKYHKEICLYTERLENFYNPYMMFQICITAPSIAMTMFTLSLLDTKKDNVIGNMLLPIVYISGALFDIFAFCFFGNEVLYESMNLPYAAFKCDWLEAPIKFKKNLLFFIHRSEKPMRMRVFYLFDFSLATYVSIIRTSYSYFALLQQFKEY